MFNNQKNNLYISQNNIIKNQNRMNKNWLLSTQKTPRLSEATKAINDISVKLPSKFLITKITKSFDKNFYQLSTKNSFESSKFKPDPTFEKTINEIKNSHIKSIASTATNPSSTTYFDKNFDPLFINNIFESEKFEPEQTFERLSMISNLII